MESDGGIRELFERIGRDAAGVIGQLLFTVTAFDAATMQVRRVYSSNPAAYPVGGRKPKRDTEFGRQVLVAGQPLVCEGDAAIARVFDDHETIRGLGAHSSLNAPVLDAGRCVGVLNFLMPGERVTPEQLQAAGRFASDAGVIATLRTLIG
jgi:hypothetical protein